MTAAKYRQLMLEAGSLSALVNEDALHLVKSRSDSFCGSSLSPSCS
jgi:hypothetical protein